MPNTALWCLRLSVALQCFAAARIAWVAGSAVNGWLFMRAGLPEGVGSVTDQIAAIILLLVSASALFRPERILFLLGAAWMLAIALATFFNPGTTSDSLALCSHAVRIAAPLCLAIALPNHQAKLFGTITPSPTALWILLVGTAATFTAHGIEALQHYGRFVDLLIGSGQLLGLTLSQSSAESILTGIGLHDLLLVILLFSRRWRGIAGWMAIWGFATALSRMTTMGGDSWHQTAVRVANGGAPLTIFLAWTQLRPSTSQSRRP